MVRELAMELAPLKATESARGWGLALAAALATAKGFEKVSEQALPMVLG